MMIPEDKAELPFQDLGIGEITKKLRQSKAREVFTENQLRKKVGACESRTKVIDAVTILHETEQGITRQRLREITGLSPHICDDHLNRLVEEGCLTRVISGVYELVLRHPKPRTISHTLLPDGISNIEIGDIVLILTPKERRMLGKLLMSDAIEHNNMQANKDFNVLISEMATCMLLLRRGQTLQDELGRQLDIPLDSLTSGLSDRIAVIAERLIEGTYTQGM